MDIIKPASREGQGLDKKVLYEKLIYISDKLILNKYLENYKSIEDIIENNNKNVEAVTSIGDRLLPKFMIGEIMS